MPSVYRVVPDAKKLEHVNDPATLRSPFPVVPEARASPVASIWKHPISAALTFPTIPSVPWIIASADTSSDPDVCSASVAE